MFLKMDLILDLPFQHSNGLFKEVHEVLPPYGSQGPLEKVHSGVLDNQILHKVNFQKLVSRKI